MNVRYVSAFLLLWLTSLAHAAPVFVDGAWLEKQLSDSKIVIIDMSEEDTQYLRFHLPGAIRLPYDVLVKPRPSDKVRVRLPDAELINILGRSGIKRDSHVVVYDDLGGLNAARLFWELERIGHPEISVLSGGLVKWILDGRRVVATVMPREAVQYVRGGAGRDNEASLQDVRTAADKKTIRLLDVRTQEEYVGEPKKPRTGHVPGAQLWPWDTAVDFDHGFVPRDAAAVRQSLEHLGAGRDQSVILYCRSGHRAAHTYLTMRALGFENVKVYTNSMNEYERHPEAPLTRGQVP